MKRSYSVIPPEGSGCPATAGRFLPFPEKAVVSIPGLTSDIVAGPQAEKWRLKYEI